MSCDGPMTVHKIDICQYSNVNFGLCLACVYRVYACIWKVFKRKMETMARFVRDVYRISVYTQARFLGRIGYMELVTWHDWSWLGFFHRVTGVGTFRWPLVHGYGPAIDYIFVPSQGRYKLCDSRNLLPHPKYFWQCTHELWKHGLSCWCLMWMPAQWTTLKLVIRLNCFNRYVHFIFTILHYLFIDLFIELVS